MSGPVSSRGTRADPRARVSPTGPLSGWQGAPTGEATRKERPVDTIKGVWGLAPGRGVGAEPPQDTVARKVAEEKA